MINKLVPISNAFTQLAEETDVDVLKMKPTLIRWAKQADQRIGSGFSYTHDYFVLDVANMEAELPYSAVRIEGIILGDVLDSCPNVFNTISPSVQEYNDGQIIWKWDSLNDMSTLYRLNWSIQNNKIVFQTPFTNTQITVKMLVYESDQDGIPLVPEGHIEAIAIFLQAKVAMKERYNKYKKGKLSNMDLSFVQILKGEFVNQSRLSSSNDENNSDNHQDDAADIMNNPFSGSSNIF